MNLLRRILTLIRRARYPGSLAYWEKRYAAGGDSGSGSSGRLAAYKAGWLNRFVQENNIHSVVEFGCGDGQQLLLAQYPQYQGLDVAPSAIMRCRALFAGDDRKQFARYDPDRFDPLAVQADLAISLEVIFHLTEERLYQLYMEHLFASARRYVVIFASDTDDVTPGPFPHFRQRRFTADVPPGWVLSERVENPHRDVSVSDFFVFFKPSDRRLYQRRRPSDNTVAAINTAISERK
ncbi:MAG: class I SAM-dependent methyltransferase [Thermoanaerobaculia bacterium]|nr:class I SAM-dependent methyltransferase [Thermoanaerobaculia bacterium]